MITEKNHKLLTSQIFLTDCTKKGLASMQYQQNEQVPLILTELTKHKKKDHDMILEIQILTDRHKNMEG